MYNKYIKYYNKVGGIGPGLKYLLLDLDESYILETNDPFHHPSSELDDFNSQKNIYYKLNSIDFHNKYITDFYNKYNKNKYVKYFTRDELNVRKCILNNNKIKSPYLTTYIASQELPIPEKNRQFIYIMDPDGTFYLTLKEKFVIDGKNYQINHTSMSRGSKVSSAGWITINELFEITEIANMSGHYKSKEQSVYNALDSLNDKEINLIPINLKYKLSIKEPDPPKLSADVWYRAKYNYSEYTSPNIDYIKYKITSKFYDNQLLGDYVISGSILYKTPGQYTDTSDVDSVFIFQTRKDLEKCINDNRGRLHKLFGLEILEQEEFTSEELDYFIENNIEIIRLSGKILGRKVTIKLFSYDKYDLNNFSYCRTFIKYKNKRIFERHSIYDNKLVNIMLMNKVISPSLTVILDKNYYKTETTIVPGLITDLLMTCELQYSLGAYWYKFKELMEKRFIELFIFEKSKCTHNLIDDNIPQYLVRYEKFRLNAEYLEKINSYISNLYTKYKNNYCIPTSNYILETDSTLWKIDTNNKKYSNKVFKLGEYKRTIKYNIADITSFFAKNKFEEIGNSINKKYSSNPNIGYFKDKMGNRNFYKIKRKEFESVYHEYIGYNKLKLFYDDLIEPKTDDNFNIIYYPVIENTVLMDDLLRINTIKLNTEPFNKIINIELKRAENLLNGFLQSITYFSTAEEKIHLLFYDRLVNRWNEWGYDELFNKQVTINNIKYNKVNIDDMRTMLNPENLDKYIKVLGLSDNHAGNIILPTDSSTEYYNIDYEYASITHPCQNIAKYLFIDVFCDVLYDEYPEDIIVTREGTTYTHNYNMSEQKKILLRIKLLGVLGDFLKIASKSVEKELFDNWETILRYSLFCCSALTKKIDTTGNKILKLLLSYEILNDVISIPIEIENRSPELYLNTLINELKIEN
jgi:hypothetical protein